MQQGILIPQAGIAFIIILIPSKTRLGLLRCKLTMSFSVHAHMYYRSTEKIDIIASRNMDFDGQTTIIVSRLLSYIIIVKSLVTKLLLADKSSPKVYTFNNYY